MLAEKFLNKRDFQSILELVESDLYKARKNIEETNPDEYESSLTELRGELMLYMSYLDIPDESDEYDYY